MLRTLLAVLFLAASLPMHLMAEADDSFPKLGSLPEVPGLRNLAAEMEKQREALVRAELLTKQNAIVPGKPLTVGFRMKMAEHWHVYWLNPGDSGQAPSIIWDLPEGWKAGPIKWPIPELHKEPGDMVIYGYDHEVTLLVELTPPADLPPGQEVTLKARLEWLVCKAITPAPENSAANDEDDGSLPRELSGCIPGEADLAVTLPVGTEAEPANAELFAATEAKLPEEGAPPYALRWEPKDTEVFLKIDGLPEKATVEFFPSNFQPTRPSVTAPGTIRLFYPHQPDAPVIKGMLVITDPVTGQRAGWYVEHRGNAPVSGAAKTSKSSNASGFDAQSVAAAGQLSLGHALMLGFLGGFILNLMPCVLPVIALKIFGFISQAGESRAKVFKMGLAFTAGVFAWFLMLAAVVSIARISGKEVSWAFQFQNPIFVYSVMIMIFVFSLNLLGVFEIWIPGTGKLVNLSGKEGYGGAFVHGAFATLLATPCTGPFLGPALPFAFTQPVPVTFGMFAAIAAGMSLPYILLTAQPAWMQFLPKPGDWMVRLKQFMGVLLLGTVVWLLGVYQSLAEQKNAGISALWMLLGIGTICWIFGTWMLPGSKAKQKIFAVGAMVAVFFVARFFAQPMPTAHWEEWSAERVRELQQNGKPVFVDFTADWCLTCKYNERTVLASEDVKQALGGFATLKADWTRRDPEIAAALKEQGRSGVPVYLVYPEGGGKPQILPEILTQGIVLDALKRAKE